MVINWKHRGTSPQSGLLQLHHLWLLLSTEEAQLLVRITYLLTLSPAVFGENGGKN